MGAGDDTRYPFKDYGNDVVVTNFPEEYLGDDESLGSPLKHYLITLKNSLNARYSEIDAMKHLVSPLEIPQALISNLADAIGVGVDEYEPEDFQRSIVNNSVQYYILKGTQKAYKIRGLMSGFEAEVINLWAIDSVYEPLIPHDFKIEVPPGSGKWYSFLSPVEVSGVSGIPFYGDCTFCLASYVGLRVTIQQLPEKAYETNVLDRIIVKIKEIMPIHIRELFVELIVDFIVPTGYPQAVHPSAGEESYLNVGESYRFDIWPGDVVGTDIGLTVGGEAIVA